MHALLLSSINYHFAPLGLFFLTVGYLADNPFYFLIGWPSSAQPARALLRIYGIIEISSSSNQHGKRNCSICWSLRAYCRAVARPFGVGNSTSSKRLLSGMEDGGPGSLLNKHSFGEYNKTPCSKFTTRPGSVLRVTNRHRAVSIVGEAISL